MLRQKSCVSRHDFIFSCLLYYTCLRFGIMPMQVAKSFTKSSVSILKNEAIIAVMSASIVAPFVVPKINELTDSVPLLREHRSIASFVVGLAIFSVAGTIFRGNAIGRAIVIGIAGAFILSALLPIYTQLTSKSGAMP